MRFARPVNDDHGPWSHSKGSGVKAWSRFRGAFTNGTSGWLVVLAGWALVFFGVLEQNGQEPFQANKPVVELEEDHPNSGGSGDPAGDTVDPGEPQHKTLPPRVEAAFQKLRSAGHWVHSGGSYRFVPDAITKEVKDTEGNSWLVSPVSALNAGKPFIRTPAGDVLYSVGDEYVKGQHRERMEQEIKEYAAGL